MFSNFKVNHKPLKFKAMKTITLTVLAGLVSLIILLATKKEEKSVTPKSPIGIVDACDGTGSIKDWEPLTKEDFVSQIDYIKSTRRGGFIYVFNVSNPIPTPVILNLEPLETESAVYKAQESEILKSRERNSIIEQRNEQRIIKFLAELDGFILDYKPPKDKDYSYVNSTFNQVINTIEFLNKSSAESYLFIYSDLLNETPGSPETGIDSTLLTQINNLKVSVALCSYTEIPELQKIEHTAVSSPREFIKVLTSKKQTL